MFLGKKPGLKIAMLCREKMALQYKLFAKAMLPGKLNDTTGNKSSLPKQESTILSYFNHIQYIDILIKSRYPVNPL